MDSTSSIALLIILLLVNLPSNFAKIDPNNLMCLVCRTTIDELENSIRKIDPKKTVEVGNYRLDESGNIHQNRVPLSKSEVHISELLDSVCKAMNDYVRVKYKATQKLAIMKMMLDGKMNPDFSLTDFVTDEDLNKSLEFYCDSVVGENEDFIVPLYASRADSAFPDGKAEVCEKHLELCEDWMYPDDEDRDWTPEKQREYVRTHGPDPYGFGGLPQTNEMSETDNYDEPEEEEEVDAGMLELKQEL